MIFNTVSYGSGSSSSVNAKIFNVSLASAMTSLGNLVVGDETVAAHYNDTNLNITIFLKSDSTVPDSGITIMSVGNTAYGEGELYGARGQLNAGTVAAGAIIESATGTPSAAVALFATSTGNISARMSSGRNSLQPGNYKIIFSW